MDAAVRAEIEDATKRSAEWLCAVASGPLEAIPNARAMLAIGLHLASRIVGTENDCSVQGRMLAADHDAPRHGDPVVAAAGYALSGASGAAHARRLLEVSLRESLANGRRPPRALLAAEILGLNLGASRTARDRHEVDALNVALGTPEQVAVICDELELRYEPAERTMRADLAQATLGRAFSALRGLRHYALATQLVRVVAIRHPWCDEPACRALFAGAAVRQRRLLRVCPERGERPSLAYRVPWTVLTLWTLHDAVADLSFVGAMRRAVAATNSSAIQEAIRQ